MLSRSEWENAVAVIADALVQRGVIVQWVDTAVRRSRRWIRDRRTLQFDDAWTWGVCIHIKLGAVIVVDGNSPEACLEQLHAEIAKRFPIHTNKPPLVEQLAASDG